MYAKLICDPPLGQPTIVTGDLVNFSVVIETFESNRSWELALWHNFNEPADWQELALEESGAVSQCINQTTTSGDVQRQLFTTILSGRPASRTVVQFTIKFRAAGERAWKWANDQFDISDGHIIYQPADIPQQELGFYIDGLSTDLEVSKQNSDTPDTLLWSLSGKVEAASGKKSGYSKLKLGTPSNSLKWFALVRIWSPWLAPRHGHEGFEPDKEAVFASFLRHDGFHVAVLAISGVDNVLTLLGHDGSGGVTVNARNDADQDGTYNLVVAVGRSFETANAAAMYYARRLIMKYDILSPEMKADMDALSDGGVNAKWMEHWYDGLAYCTWNGLGQHLSEQRILDALDSLKENNINITNLIIDDNWQSLDNEGQDQFQRGWMRFEANKEGFPDGLKGTTTKIRERHKNIQHIAVWHALLGYWGGISPDGELARTYKTQRVQKRDGVAGGTMLAVSASDVSQFYADFYRFLSSSGVDSVKTDAQFFLDELDDAPDRRALMLEYQDAWAITNLRYFSAKAISCMSQAPQILFHSQMPTSKPRLLVRNSDDFFPEVPASHPWHIFCNAYNALFTQHLNVLPDWDMFQTSHPWASFHAAARCVSGGPIYITDTPGKHDADLINQMSATTPRGDTVILRPSVVGKTINAYVGYDEKTLLKIGTYVGHSGTGSSILGVFNTTTQPLTEVINLSQFAGTQQGEYLIRSHKSGKVTSPSAAADKSSFVSVSLEVQSWDILTAYAARAFKLQRAHETAGSTDVKVANLGLLGKMTGAAAVVSTEMYVDRNSGKLRVWTSLKALGTYGLYISDLANRSLEDDFIGLLFGQAIPLHCVKKSSAAEDVLEIDVARAWKESDQRSGWSNEVAIEVVIR